MNREIKFRAWYEDKEPPVYCQMLYVGDDKGTTHPLECCKYFMEGQPVTLMQFTGLIDKNGKDIYEGDIVKHVSELIKPFDGNKRTGKVSTKYKIVEYRDDSGAFCWSDSALIGINQGIVSKYGEVVGNIFENPELIEITDRYYYAEGLRNED